MSRKKNSVKDITVRRLYKCTNEDCLSKSAYEQSACSDFRKKCPHCNKNTLILESGSCSVSTFMELNVPKTFGAQSEKNCKDREKKLGKKKVNEKLPWWRKSEKINHKILKDPNRYISEGKL